MAGIIYVLVRRYLTTDEENDNGQPQIQEIQQQLQQLQLQIPLQNLDQNGVNDEAAAAGFDEFGNPV